MRRLIKWLRKFILENFVKGYRPSNVMWDITVQIKGRPLTACTHTTYNKKVSFIKTSVLHSIPIMNSFSAMVPVIYYAAYFWSDKYFLSFFLQRAFDYCLQTEYWLRSWRSRTLQTRWWYAATPNLLVEQGELHRCSRWEQR